MQCVFPPATPQCALSSAALQFAHGHSPYGNKTRSICLHASMTQILLVLFPHCSLLTWTFYHIFPPPEIPISVLFRLFSCIFCSLFSRFLLGSFLFHFSLKFSGFLFFIKYSILIWIHVEVLNREEISYGRERNGTFPGAYEQ